MPVSVPTKHARWIEKTLGVITVVCALVVWQELSAHDRHQTERMVTAAAKSVQADLLADMAFDSREQNYLAEFGQSPATTKKNWTVTAQRYLQLNQGCVGVLWLDNTNHVVTDLFAAADQEAVRQAVMREAGQALDEVKATKQPRQTRSFQLPTGERVFLTVVPAVANATNTSSAIFVNDVGKLFAAMLNDDSGLGYNVAVFDAGTEVYRLFADSRPAEERWSRTVQVPVQGQVWTARVWPRAEMLAGLDSLMPEIMLAVVSAFGFSLIFTAHFWRVARDTSLQLSSEMDERRRIELALRESQERLWGILETSADAIISTDDALRITLFNEGAKQIFGFSKEEVIGQPLNMLLPKRFRESHRHHMLRFATGSKATMQMTERGEVVGLRKNGTEFPADAAISKLNVPGGIVLTAILRDISARVAAEESLRMAHHELEQRVAERTKELATANASLRRLSGHLLRSQEEERRRIARELHDNTAGNLVFIGMTLDNISSCASREEIMPHVEECRSWIQRTMEDIRTLSYRMHPPMLDGLGLLPALRWYSAGFSKRSGVAILLQFDPSTPRLPSELESAMFRVVQEALTNVHRHSRANKAEINVTHDGERVQLSVTDNGVGIASELLKEGTARFGVGIAGMAERIRQLGGDLDIQSSPEGTTITATVPATESISEKSASYSS